MIVPVIAAQAKKKKGGWAGGRLRRNEEFQMENFE